MKKVIVATILGLAAANSFGQGSILFDNYSQGTYSQVVWGPGIAGHPAGTPVNDTTVSLQLYFAEGTGLTFAQLAPGVLADVDITRQYPGGAGLGGWFSGATQLLPTWAAGDTFSFAVVVTGPSGYFGQTPVWTETTAIHGTMAQQSGFLNFPGLTVNVPEPTTFALAGLGSAALLIFRRRRA